MGEEVKEKKPNKVSVAFKEFFRFLYNPDDHTVLGRGGESWGKIIIFYFFFYAALAAFFAVCLIVMLQTIDPDVPTVTGRTNKPVVAINDGNLYTMDFKNADIWDKYVAGVDKLMTSYNENAPEDTTKQFIWNSDSLADCADKASFIKNTETEKSGCFFMGLNRMYKWEPFDSNDTANADKHLAFNCTLDQGKAGNGNLNPPFTLEMNPPVGEQEIEKYYPWTSLKETGLQPVVGLKITMNIADMNTTPDDKLTSYIMCYPYIRVGGELEKLPSGRPIELTVQFTNSNQ